MTLVIVAILVQLSISVILPYVLMEVSPFGFNYIYIPIEAVLSVLAAILMVRVINSNMNIEGQIAWIILFLLFPILGISLYFIFVRRRMPMKYKPYYKKMADEIKPYLKVSTLEDIALKEGLGKYYGQFKYIQSATGLRVYENTDVKFLPLGEIFYTELLQELKSAKKYIFMEYFIIERGRMWNQILAILKQKVSEGVEVRVMYDDLGSINKLPSNYCKYLNKLGIKCIRFNAFVPILTAFHNNRDHRKMTIIDGKVGFMSGLNIADEYINVVQPYGYWKDTGVKLTGQAVRNMLLMFLEQFAVQNEKVEDVGQYMPNNITALNASGFVCPYGDGPRYFYSDNVAQNVFLNMINQAQKYVWITTPYLIIDNKLTNALCNAAKRGVDVRIVTPHIPDKKYIFMITRYSYKTLQEAGVKIFEFTKGFMHSKQVLVDDDIGVVGTINFDYRSLLHHYECGVLMCKTACLKDIKRDFVHVFTISQNMKDFKQNPFIRLFCAIIKVFQPML